MTQDYGTTAMMMTQLNLTDSEASILRKVLESYLSDLRMEIADTEEAEFRERLKQQEMVIHKIIGALAQ
jgi:hypothetical protein